MPRKDPVETGKAKGSIAHSIKYLNFDMDNKDQKNFLMSILYRVIKRIGTLNIHPNI